MDVFFATDRNRTNSEIAKNWFGTERGKLSFGKCSVTIPVERSPGELPGPTRTFMDVLRNPNPLDLWENPSRHVVLQTISELTKENFLSRISADNSEKAFIFIHGYNVTFEDAARRTAQIAFDLKFSGAPLFYSWPSHGGLDDYTRDEQNIEWSQANIQTFLGEIAKVEDLKNIYLIAHSMGSRGLTKAFIKLQNDSPQLAKKFREIILAAPDIDAAVFKRDIAPYLNRGNTTLYASSRDKALEASDFIHGNPRAGDSESGLVIVDGLETIDATEVDTSFIGHSYYGDVKSVLSDIFYLINHGLRANQRSNLHEIVTTDGKYWLLR